MKTGIRNLFDGLLSVGAVLLFVPLLLTIFDHATRPTDDALIDHFHDR